MSKGRFLKPSEVAEKLSVSTFTVKRWLREGRITGYKVQGMWRVYESDLEQMIQKVHPDDASVSKEEQK